MVELNALAFKMDSTKLLAYMRCPRRFLFEHVFGWRSEAANLDLSFGGLWHRVLEHWHITFDLEACKEMLRLGCAELEEVGEAPDPRAPKGYVNACLALDQYSASGYGREWKVLAQEVPGSFEIAGHTFYVNVDLIVERPDGRVVVVDHKTGSKRLTKWDMPWLGSIQMGSYLYVTEQVFGERLYGAEVSTMFFYKPDADKKTGALTAKNEHIPIELPWDEKRKAGWDATLRYWLQLLDCDKHYLECESHEDSVLFAFPQRAPEACHSYMRPCPYMDLCFTEPNPLKIWSPGNPPIGLQETWWDPEKRECVGCGQVATEEVSFCVK